MGSWTIYSKNGVAKAVVKELELHDEWMAECFLTLTINSATPIQFAVGDYIDYRDERYTIEYDPNVIKRATSGTYGEGFVYDGIKFVGSQDEIVRCDFNDIVLSDNNVHYTALPTFPFYCESVDDLLDRIQANLEDLYPNQWIVIGLNTVRNSQRGSAVGRQTAFENAYKKWIDPDMTPHTDPYGKQSVAESADNITCWDALAKVHEDFGLNFIVRGKVVVVGTAGVFTANTFQYGKGNGLEEIEKVGDSSQQIATRLRAYGSETNLPLHYYSAINMLPYGNVVAASDTGLFQIDVAFKKEYFVHEFSSGETDVVVKVGNVSYNAKAYINSTTGNININIQTAVSVAANAKVYITEGVKRDMWPNDHKDYSQDALPENMAVSRLMLPMFPNQSLYDWVKAHRDAGTTYNDETGLATYHGITAYFSKEPHRPYIDSLNKAQYGVRPASIYFDGSNETEDIHPTIEGMTYNNVRVDAVYAADQIEDNGVYDDSSVTVPNFHITLPDLGFNLAEVYEENASIDMKDGMCGGRSFKLAAKPTQDSNGRWVCEVQREKDDNLNLFFPYCDFQISSGNHYVLTGIQMPDAYIEAAAVKLLGAALDALQKNEAPRFTYQPKIDKNFMQRQHDTAMSSQGVVSLHDTLKAGDVFVFADADMGVDASIIIDVLTIKENGDNGIPTYEVTLRDEKQVSTIQKIQNKIDSVINGAININSGVGGLTAQQVRSLINNYGGEQFLSKLNDDTAAGYITMLKGLQIGANFVPDILGEGGVLRMRDDGKVELVTDILYARVKAYFDSVEIREYQHTGGNRIASVAGNRMCRIEWYDANNEVLEQTQANLSSVAYFRCYFRASDGEDTVRNNWVVGDLAYCHVTSIVNSSDNPEQKGLNQKHLWRLVIGRNTEGTLTEDGEAYIDLSNRATETISGASYTGYQSGSDVPEAQDDVIQLGNVNDTTRQGAIVEFVTGTDAPSYQIYQGINSFSLNNKNQIGFGYNTSTGRAYLNVYGDAYVGARDRSTFIEYKQSGTGGNPELNIKAHVEFTNSDAELDELVQGHQNNYDDTEVRGLINGLQEQIDGQVESWFFDYPPVHVDEHGAPDSKVPLNVAPYSDWTDDNAKIAHLGDTFTDNSSGYCWRFTRNENTNAFEWTPIEDSAIISALQNAARAQDTADHKRRVFLTQPVPPYDTGDMWANAVYPANYTGVTDEAAHKYNNDILKCVTSKASDGSFSINDWTLASKYTDDSKFNGYIDAMLNDTGLSGDSAAATAQKAILSALGVGTVVAGGLLLSSLIGMRQYNGSGDKSDVSNYTTWAGISGQYNANVLGGGMAAWYGGGMVDKETLSEEQIGQGWDTLRWAKGVDRFDGSGYRADGNITWDEQGRVSIKDVTTIISSNNTDVLNELITFNNAFHFNLSQGTSTVLSIEPQAAFTNLYIRNTTNPDAPYHVATEDWVDDHYVSKTFFRQLFRAFKPNTTAGQADVEVEPNTIDATISNIKAMVGFWTEQYVSALGNNSDGGGGGASVLYGLNDVTPNATGDGVMGAQDGYVLTYNGSTHHWYAAATAETYVLPQATADALGGIKIGYATSGKNYAIALDTNGKAYVNVPWTDHCDWGDITNTPTTIAGYGITDAYTKTEVDSLARLESVAFSSDGVLAFTLQDGSVSYVDLTHQHDFQEILERPTTLAGFGIDDAKIESGVITLGNNTITPITSVAMTVPTGFSISGTPISKTGTLALSYSSGYEGFTTELKNMITALYSWFEVDSNGDIKTKDYTSNGTTKHRGFWSPSFISALGQGSDSGGGGQGDVTWELLQTQATDDRYIHLSYISAALESYLTTNNYVQSSDISDMATKTWVGNQGYLTQQSLSSYYTKSEVDALARLTNVAYSSDGILAFTHQDGSTTYADFTHEHSFLELLDRPTTIAGYEISDIYINSGVVYIGDSSITPVTSVAMTVPTGFSISGSPISKTGTLAVSYASGYEGFTTSLKEKIEALFSWFELDSDGNVKTKDYVDNGTTKHRGFWSESFISALGEGNDGGGGGQGDVTWALLASQATGGRTIHSSYISGTLANYLPLSGGTMTGVLTLPANLYNGYETSGQTYAINANNSDIINVNSILTYDLSDSWKESIGFKRTNGNYDTFRAADGTFYFGVNNGTEYTAIHSGNIGSQSVNFATSTNTLNVNSGGFTTGAAGWYKLATIASTDPRGSVRIGLITNGGGFTPCYAELYVKNGWSNTDFILYGRFDHISKFRLTKDSTNTYIEGYFPTASTIIVLRKIVGRGYVSDETPNWTLYSSATAGSGTVDGSVCERTSLTTGIYSNKPIETSEGFVKTGSSDSYVLLGGGGHATISSLSVSYATSAGSATKDGSGNTISSTYLKLSGGTIKNDAFAPLIIERTNSGNMAGIGFKNNKGVLGYIATSNVDGAFVRYNAAASTYYTILDSSNSSVSKSGETLTVKINGTTQSLTNTWRGITNDYNPSSASESNSLSQKGAQNLYNAVTKTGARWSWGGNGNYGYCLVAEIDTGFGYINFPINFEFTTRGGRNLTIVTIRFKYQQAVDPDVDVFGTNGDTNFFLYKVETSKWRLYAQSMTGGVWGSLYLTRIVSYLHNRVTVKMENVSSLPTGYVTPSYIGNAAYATSAGTASSCTGNSATATKLQTSRTLWGQSFNGTANVSGNMTGVGTISASGNNTITKSNTDDTGFIAKNNNGQIELITSTSRGVYDRTGSNWLIATNGTNTFLSRGNVGIGTTSPAYKLDVNGTIHSNSIVTSHFSNDECYIGTQSNGIGSGNVGTLILTYGNHSTLFYTNATARMCITGAGRVGIGTTSPSYTFHVTGTFGTANGSGSVTFSSDNVLRISHGDSNYSEGIRLTNYNGTSDTWSEINFGCQIGASTGTHAHQWTVGRNGNNNYFVIRNNSAERLEIDLSGNITVAANFTANGGITCLASTSSSDIRLKDVQGNVNLNVEQVADAPAIRFLWKKDHSLGMQAGSIAQYWQNVLPETIKEDNEGILSMNYGVAALVAAITTARKVVDHEKEIAQLKNRVKALEDENKMLKTKLIA